jgi:hypothetical protein
MKLRKVLKNRLPIIRNPKYYYWMQSLYPNQEIHHITGGYRGCKHNDLLLLPLTTEEHHKEHSNSRTDVTVEQLAFILTHNFCYLYDILEPEQIKNDVKTKSYYRKLIQNSDIDTLIKEIRDLHIDIQKADGYE